jgi:hypothetical protein
MEENNSFDETVAGWSAIACVLVFIYVAARLVAIAFGY